jgi:hypothetical protein
MSFWLWLLLLLWLWLGREESQEFGLASSDPRPSDIPCIRVVVVAGTPNFRVPLEILEESELMRWRGGRERARINWGMRATGNFPACNSKERERKGSGKSVPFVLMAETLSSFKSRSSTNQQLAESVSPNVRIPLSLQPTKRRTEFIFSSCPPPHGNSIYFILISFPPPIRSQSQVHFWQFHYFNFSAERFVQYLRL